MVKNYSELTRSLNKGFLLNEQELKRIIDVISEQFDKLGENKKAKYNYTIKNFNGLVEETDNLEHLLKSENIGNSQIIELIIIAISEDESNSIFLKFSNNLSDRNGEERAIKYTIKSEERDWAIISSSLIDDRLNRISKNNVTSLLIRRIIAIFIAIFMISMISYVTFILGDKDSNNNITLKTLNNIEKSIAKGTDLDILSSIVKIEKSKIETHNSMSLSKYILMIFVPFLLLTLFAEDLRKLTNRYFPSRIFYWGDFIEKYDKMIRRRNFFLGFIFITIVISIIINLFSNYLWERVIN
ncbi:hypothetical protein [Chryseobacterium sp. RLHN22]|uniref:hypothetical protein n=1 Tax=Chryseobacterium sp. RLHN22 TaxID=3437885 RepID=UPI003D9BB882